MLTAKEICPLRFNVPDLYVSAILAVHIARTSVRRKSPCLLAEGGVKYHEIIVLSLTSE